MPITDIFLVYYCLTAFSRDFAYSDEQMSLIIPLYDSLSVLSSKSLDTVSTIQNATAIQNWNENAATKHSVFSPNSVTAKQQLSY